MNTLNYIVDVSIILTYPSLLQIL